MFDRQRNRKQPGQQQLDQINEQLEAVETLSDEELESVAGGYMIANTNLTTTTNMQNTRGAVDNMMPDNKIMNTGTETTMNPMDTTSGHW